jgi:hypothetical protein
LWWGSRQASRRLTRNQWNSWTSRISETWSYSASKFQARSQPEFLTKIYI